MGLGDRLQDEFYEKNKNKITPEVIKQILAEVYVLDHEYIEIVALEILGIDKVKFDILVKELRELA